MNIVSVSGHALERFREHAPEADAAAVLLAARMAIPIESELAHMLAGRPHRAAQHADDSAHRVHLSGAGIFVLCPLPGHPGALFVKTYLRMGSVVQREMVRRWFLAGVSPVTTAFELGFRAAREAPESVTVGEAREAYAAELLGLAAHEGAVREVALREVAERAQTGIVEPPVDDAPAAVAPRCPPTLRAHWSPSAFPAPTVALIDGVAWTQAALDQRAWHRAHDADWVSDMARWRRLSEDEQAPFFVGTHLGPMGPATDLWLEPAGRSVALVVERRGQPPQVHRLSAVPRTVRLHLGLPAKVSLNRPGATARSFVPIETPEARSGSSPSPRTEPRVEAPPPHAETVAGSTASEEAPTTPPRFVAADGLRVSHWNARAHKDAREADLTEIPAAWIGELEAVPVEACPDLVARLHWPLLANRSYAMRRGAGSVVLLVSTGRENQFAVARCARDPDA